MDLKWFKRFKGLGMIEIKNSMVCYFLKTDSRIKTAFSKLLIILLHKVFNLSKYKKGNFSMVNFIKILFEKI